MLCVHCFFIRRIVLVHNIARTDNQSDQHRRRRTAARSIDRAERDDPIDQCLRDAMCTRSVSAA